MNGRIETYTGRMVDPLDLQPDDVCIEDIAYHLAAICRYTGACARTYSVAEHSRRVADMIPRLITGGAAGPDYPEWAWIEYAALMHDAGEAYCNDFARPVKNGLLGVAYREAEDTAMRVISGVFHFTWPKPLLVAQADDILCWIEADVLMKSRGRTWEAYEPAGRLVIEKYGDVGQAIRARPHSREANAELFLARFQTLSEAVKVKGDAA